MNQRIKGTQGFKVISPTKRRTVPVRPPGGGGNLTYPWYGVVPFFKGTFFMIDSGFMGMVFNNF